MHPAQRHPGVPRPEGGRHVPDRRYATGDRGQVAPPAGRDAGRRAVLGRGDQGIMSGLDIGSGRRRRARRISAVAATVLVAGAGIGVGYAATSSPSTDSGTGPAVPISLATVTRGTVTER